jgi:hypothetical protein
MTAIDPYRTLGLAPGATQAEIKVAYRRLAKLNHPDSAGERALPRFLAIQAAYEALIEDPTGLRRRGRPTPASRPAGPPAAPWHADAARARATREAYRARTRGARGGPGPDPPGGRPGPGGSPPGAAESGARSRRSSRRPKATIGSTSYDDADKEPFDPAWEGATWYGAGSGTYWTLNPKEYADPRKHGPEYLARSRRPIGRRDAADGSSGAEGTPDIPEAAGGPPGSDGVASDGASAAEGQAGSPSRATLRRRRPAQPPPSPAEARRPFRATQSTRPSIDPTTERGARPSGGSSSGAARTLAATVPGRIGVALVGWIPIAIGLAALGDVLPACSGVVTTCSDPLTGGLWLVDLIVLGSLIAVPRLGWIAAVASVAFFVGGLIATPVLVAVGGARTAPGTATALAVVLVAAWLGGVFLALTGRVEGPPWRPPRVR